MQILPSEVLLPYIKHFLFLESNGNYIKKLRLFSDGNTGMVFCVNERPLSIDGTNDLPNSFLYGQISNFRDLYRTEESSFIIVVFQPDGLHKLLGISAKELKDNIITTNDIFGRSGLFLYDKLIGLKGVESRLKILNKFFHELAAKRTLPDQNFINASLNYIVERKGIISVEGLVKYTGYTERHIQREFSERIGLSPKQFGSIVKLHNFLKVLKNKSSGTNIATMGYETGYFDQSHLNREFRKHTGITPTQYLNGTNKLAINFMEFTFSHESMSGLYNFPC